MQRSYKRLQMSIACTAAVYLASLDDKKFSLDSLKKQELS